MRGVKGELLTDKVYQNSQIIAKYDKKRVINIQEKLLRFYDMFGEEKETEEIKLLKQELYDLVGGYIDEKPMEKLSAEEYYDLYEDQNKIILAKQLEEELSAVEDELYEHIYLYGFKEDKQKRVLLEQKIDNLYTKYKNLKTPKK